MSSSPTSFTRTLSTARTACTASGWVSRGIQDYGISQLPEFYVYGLTANLCILIAMRELRRAPDFDFYEDMTREQMETMSVDDVIEQYYRMYYERVRPGERGRGKL